MVATRGDMPATRRKALKLPASILPKHRKTSGVIKKSTPIARGGSGKSTPTQARANVGTVAQAGNGGIRRNLSKAFSGMGSPLGVSADFDSSAVSTPKRKRQRAWRGRRKRKSSSPSPAKQLDRPVEQPRHQGVTPQLIDEAMSEEGSPAKQGTVLNEADVIEIFYSKPRDKAERARVTKELTDKFPCSKYTIRDIWNSRSWVSVTSALSRRPCVKRKVAGDAAMLDAGMPDPDDASASNADTVGSPTKCSDDSHHHSSSLHSFSSPARNGAATSAVTSADEEEDDGFTMRGEDNFGAEMPNSVSDPFQSSPCGYKIISSTGRQPDSGQPYALVNKTFDNKDTGTKAGTVVIQPNAHHELLAQKSAYVVYVCQGEGKASFSLVEESGDGPSTPPLPCGEQEITENHMINLKRGTGCVFSNTHESVDLCIVWFSNRLGPVDRR